MPLLLVALLLAGRPEPEIHPNMPAPDPVLGTWSNPRRTLAVRTAPCSEGLCGEIVRAGPKALADAREAGVTRLVGTDLLRGYRRESAGRWTGRVYLPDMGRTFSSHIAQDSRDERTIAGWLIGGFFCKSQEWHRIP